jgi:uncharacterized protein (DUF1697 family)
MDTYIALFRGINVGGKNILPMKDLSKVLEEMGCRSVRTYIQSGNVVFRSEKQDLKNLALRISQAISVSHGFTPKVLLLTTDGLQAAVAGNPFPTEAGKALHFFFLEALSEAPDKKRLAVLKAKSENFKLDQHVFYLHAPDGVGGSKLAAKVEQCLNVPVTARNWNTVKRLLEIAGESEP